MKQQIIDAIRAHAQQEYPRESCGLVVVRKGKQYYQPCQNVATDPAQHFVLDPADYAAAADYGTITHVVHSHPNALPLPSEEDLHFCEASGLPWIIVNWPLGTIHEFAPSGYQAPLIGRKYIHGVQDCFSLVRDYFQREVGILLPDYEREEDWWLKGGDLYMQNLADGGGVEVTDGSVNVHDIFFMQIASPVINHAAVYIGDNMIIQHCGKRVSSRDIYGGYWQLATVKTIRHRSLIDA